MLRGMFQVLGLVERDLVVVKGEKVVALEVLNRNCYVMVNRGTCFWFAAIVQDRGFIFFYLLSSHCFYIAP